MASTIITKNSSTASATPAVGDLQQGELAVNVTDKKVYTKDSSAAIVKLVGSLGNQEASAVAITGGSIAGITDLAVADGGTGSSTAAGARSNLSAAASGANSDITSLSGLTTALSVAQGGTGVTSSTGSGSVVLSNSPTLLTPALGTPSAAVLTNATGLPLSTGISGLGTGVATFLGTPSSANLLAAVTDETGTGALVFANSPTLVTPALGTPSSATLTNATGLPISTGVSGLGTGVATALAVNVGSAGAPVVNGGVLGTPSSATLTNATGLPISTGVSGLGTGVATALAVNVGSSGAPLVNGGVLGTPSSGTATNLTGLPLTTGVTGTLPTANGGTNLTSFTSGGVVYASSSSALATGSALTFDGTNFVVNNGYIRANNTLGYYTTLTATGLTNFATSMDFDSVSDYIFKRNSSEQMRLNSTGLGIGTSSPASKLDISGGGTTAKFNTLDTYDGGASLSAWMKVGRRAGTGTNAYINTLHSGSDAVSALTWAFGTSGTGTETLRLASADGTVILKGGSTSATGTGITFPATQSASSDANTLDDYEEGTWTPTDNSGAGLSFTVYEATYTKIGRVVEFEAAIYFPSTVSTALVSFSGLPFTAAGGTDNTGGISITATNVGANYYALITRGTTVFSINTNLDIGVSNATYSSKFLKFFGVYHV